MASLVAAMSAGAAPVDFVRDVQPLLAEHCVKCHGPEKHKGELRLDHKAGAFKGGESEEPGIVPGDSGKSRVFQMVTAKKEAERMPPKGERLTAQLRMDALNVANHSQFDNPNLDPTSTNFGKVTNNTSSTMRFLLFQLRLKF